jgi:hypothetical protein
MTTQKRLLLSMLCWAFMLSWVHAQDKMPIKFGKIAPSDFNVIAPAVDSAAGAVVVADYGYSSIDNTPRGWFVISFQHSKRIRILKRTAFDAGTVIIYLVANGTQAEEIRGLKASTYTMENGQVVETKLDDKAVFTTQLSKNVVEKKFTFPNLKEGAIVEYSYTEESPFLFNLQPWAFQGEYPCLWSEYEVDIPNFFQYVTLAHGYEPFFVNKATSRNTNFSIYVSVLNGSTASRATNSGFKNLSAEVAVHRWVMKDVPSLKEEPFTTTLENHMSRIEFQLARIEIPGSYSKDELGNWNKLSEELLNSAAFGEDLDKNNGWMDDEMKLVVRGATTPMEKAQKIFTFVRDSFNCTNHESLMLSEPIKTIFKNRHGSEADLNLLLAAMLRHENLTADPVILSTRAHGLLNELYPQLSRFNYVICQLAVDTLGYYLDASEPWLGFSRLPERCFNGYARVLNKETPSAISLDPEMIKESKTTTVIISKDEKGGMTGHIEMTPGFNEACKLREKLRKTTPEEYMKTLQATCTGGITANNLEIDSLLRPDDPLQVGYDIRIRPETGTDIIYFNPTLGSGYKENLFKAAERKYPVEMPFVMDEVYTLSMDIPDGFVVDEMPRSAKILLNGEEGYFEYMIDKDETSIQFRTRVKLNRAHFEPQDYATLRDFFGAIVKKEGETIVFKRKK